MNELYSKLYKEAEKIKRWKLTVESELKQKERKLQENRKIIEAQRKAIQELQASIVAYPLNMKRESSSWYSMKILFVRLNIKECCRGWRIVELSMWWLQRNHLAGYQWPMALLLLKHNILVSKNSFPHSNNVHPIFVLFTCTSYCGCAETCSRLSFHLPCSCKVCLCCFQHIQEMHSAFS